MARDTLVAAHAELYTQLHAGGHASTIAGVQKIYPHHLARGLMVKPITATVTSAGITPDFWLLAIRVYAWIAIDKNSDPSPAATNSALLDQVVMDIDEAVSDHWGPSNWTIGPHPELEETLLAEWVVSCGREDF